MVVIIYVRLEMTKGWRYPKHFTKAPAQLNDYDASTGKYVVNFLDIAIY